MPVNSQPVNASSYEEGPRDETHLTPMAYNMIDSFVEEDMPRLDGDPFEPIFRSMLERDTKQCDAWKEEVQSILIFSGLFSAIVTAFIIESYQKLQPDPDSMIISLLSSIAGQKNSTAAPPVSSSPEQFIPSPSDIRINVFWFMSLVLSLTVALIGIVSLQWLREHQQYDSRMETSKAFAIFNARSEGLTRWYVPEIFATLPLLLQVALVLFLAGIIDLLFSLYMAVAIPVTIVTGIPSIFLLLTTILPTLQMCTMRLPYLLSVNQSVPAPCPYKSPQSLIFLRITRFFDGILGNSAWIFAILYIPIATVRRFIRNLDLCSLRPSPVYPFKGSADLWFKASQTKLTSCSGDWITADDYWLAARTSYAVIINTPNDLRVPSIDRSFALKASVAPTFYDTVQGIQKAACGAHSSDIYTNALYHAGSVLVNNQLRAWLTDVNSIVSKTDSRRLLMRGRCISLMTILGPKGPIHSRYSADSYSEIQPGNILPQLEILHSAYKAALLQRLLAWSNFESFAVAKILCHWDKAHIQMISKSLLDDPGEPFKCTSTLTLAPAWFLDHPAHYRSLLTHYTNDESRKCASNRWTTTLNSLIMKSLVLPPWTSSCPHILTPTIREQCQINFFYDNVTDLIKYIVTFQTDYDIIRILALLKDLCQAAPDPIQDRPFVVVIACSYINATTMIERHRIQGFAELFQVLYSSCGAPSKILRPGDIKYAWEGHRFALEYIRNYQAQSESDQQPRDSSHVRNSMRQSASLLSSLAAPSLLTSSSLTAHDIV